MSTGEYPKPPEDPQLKQLLSDIAFSDALAKLVKAAESAKVNLQRLDDAGLGPRHAVEIYRRYHKREYEKAQLRVEIFKLPREIEQLKRDYERASTLGAREQHKRRRMMVQAGMALGRSFETSPAEAPELKAKRKLNSAMAELESKEKLLHAITAHDDEWNSVIETTPVPQRLVAQAPPPPQALDPRANSSPKQNKKGPEDDAEVLSNPHESRAPRQSRSSAPPTTDKKVQRKTPVCNWPDIEIVFLGDGRLQIFRRKKAGETMNYGEFGLQNKTTEGPNKAWEALRQFAIRNGTIRDTAEAGMPWHKFEKRVQELRRVLREYFSNDADPIVFVEKLGYRTQFKIRCSASFNS